MTNVPTDLCYHSDHLWVRPGSEHLVRIGVSDFAQQALGDVIAVTLPAVGEKITAGDPCGNIESTKSVSDLVAPVNDPQAQRSIGCSTRACEHHSLRRRMAVRSRSGRLQRA